MTGRLRLRVSGPLIAVGIVVAGGVAGALFEMRSWILGFGVLTSSAALVWMERRRGAIPVHDHSDDIIDSVVSTAKAEGTAELEDRGLFENEPLSVRWLPADENLMDWVESILGKAADQPHDTWIREFYLSGRYDEIADLYRRIPTGRLVIIGQAGAGKTVLAIQLARRLLELRRPGERIPVVTSLASWNPRLTRFTEWLKDQLATTYPLLSSINSVGRRLADILVDDDRILPILDGLDEMLPPLRAVALATLARMKPFPLVMTCRDDEYKALFADHGEAGDGLQGMFGPGDRTPAGRPLAGAAVVEIQQLSATDIVAHLKASIRPYELPRWAPVIHHLEENPTCLLSQVLSTPLMIFLVWASYIRRSAEPTMLITLASASTEALTEHLWERFVPAMLETSSARQGYPMWDEDRVKRWLSQLARALRGKRNLVPWQLSELLPRLGLLQILVSGLLSGLIVGTAVGVIGAIMSIVLDQVVSGLGLSRVPAPTLSAPVAMCLSVAALALLSALRPPIVRGQAAQPSGRWNSLHYAMGAVTRFLVGVIGGTGVIVLNAVPDTTAAVSLIGLAGGLAVSAIAWSLADWSRDWRLSRSPRLLRLDPGKIPDALVYGLGGGLLTGLGAAATIGWGPSGIVALPAMTVGMAVNLLDGRADLVNADRAVAVLRSDRRSTALQLAAMGMVVGVFAQLGFPGQVAAAIVFGVGLGVGAGVGLSAAATLSGGIPVMFPSSVWIRYVTAKWWLVAGRQVPIRLLDFLDATYRLGILRKVGAVYQFRHAQLQEYLSGTAD